MKSLVNIIGIILIIFGIVSFSYRYFTYTTNEKVMEVGSVQVTAEQEKTVFISPAVSGIAVVAGVVLVIIGMRRR